MDKIDDKKKISKINNNRQIYYSQLRNIKFQTFKKKGKHFTIRNDENKIGKQVSIMFIYFF